jgi:type I restriction enzyme, S subunit
MTSVPAIDVSQEQWDIVRGILSRHLPGTEVWAFGSRAKWSAKAYSDLDLVAITDRPLPLAVSAAMAEEFGNSNLPWKVDLIDWSSISEGFRAIVARDKVVVQSKTKAPDSVHWPLVPISSVATVFDGPHATPEKADSGPVFLGITCLDDGRLDLSRAEHVSEDDFAVWTRRVAPRSGDVVFSYETKIGAAAVIPDDLRCCLGRRMGLVRPDPARLDARFFLYQYLGPEFQSLLRSRTIHGSTVDRISIKEFPDFEIRLPPLSVQKNITRILGSLDDKIELNRRMNDTLEAMARSIFQSWFVDFDPVRARANGEPPESICQRLGLTPELLAQFPNAFDESSLEVLPSGWQISSIGALADIVGGSTPNTKESKYWDGGHHAWATPKDLSRLSTPVLLDTERRVTDAGLAEIGSGLLAPGTVLMSSRAPIGYRAINELPVAINQGFIAMKPVNGVSRYFLLYWTEWALQEIVSRANGSTFLEISKSSFRPIAVVRPPDAVFAAFDQIVQPLYQRMVANEREALLLTEQRDALLPELLTGRTTVPIEEAS